MPQRDSDAIQLQQAPLLIQEAVEHLESLFGIFQGKLPDRNDRTEQANDKRWALLSDVYTLSRTHYWRMRMAAKKFEQERRSSVAIDLGARPDGDLDASELPDAGLPARARNLAPVAADDRLAQAIVVALNATDEALNRTPGGAA